MKTLFVMFMIYVIVCFVAGGIIDLSILMGDAIGRVILLVWWMASVLIAYEKPKA